MENGEWRMENGEWRMDSDGFPDAINNVYAQIHIQLCIIHMVRNSLKYVSWKDYKGVTSGLKRVSETDRGSGVDGAGEVCQCLG